MFFSVSSSGTTTRFARMHNSVYQSTFTLGRFLGTSLISPTTTTLAVPEHNPRTTVYGLLFDRFDILSSLILPPAALTDDAVEQPRLLTSLLES